MGQRHPSIAPRLVCDSQLRRFAPSLPSARARCIGIPRDTTSLGRAGGLPRGAVRGWPAFLASSRRGTGGGGRGIRTPGTREGPAVFKTAAISRSAIPPCEAHSRRRSRRPKDLRPRGERSLWPDEARSSPKVHRQCNSRSRASGESLVQVGRSWPANLAVGPRQLKARDPVDEPQPAEPAAQVTAHHSTIFFSIVSRISRVRSSFAASDP